MSGRVQSSNDDDEDMSAEAVIARAIARRGEIFDEFRLLAQESPRTYDLISKTAGYMHHYRDKRESAGYPGMEICCDFRCRAGAPCSAMG